MDNLQQKILSLLVDIDCVCKKHGLKYFLGKGTAIQAVRWGRFLENCHSASVFMPCDDYDRFEEIMSSHPLPNRVVESLRTNAQFPYTCMRFVDEQTTYISLCSSRLEKHPGVAVYIEKLQPYNKHSRRKLSLIKSFGAVRFAQAFNKSVSRDLRTLNKLRVRFLERRGKKAIVKMYGARLIGRNAEYQKVYVQRYRPKALFFSKELFDEYLELPFEGKLLRVPKRYDEFLRVMNGRHWEYCAISHDKLGTNVFVDLDVPYKEYLPLIDENFEKIERVSNARYKRDSILSERRLARKPIDLQQRYYTRAVDRVQLSDRYFDQKSSLLSLYRVGDFGSLAYALGEYQKKAQRYLRWNMGFAFDKDLYRVMRDVFAWEGLSSDYRKMGALQQASFDYLDNLPNCTSVSSLEGNLYTFADEDGLLVSRVDTNRAFPVASHEKSVKLNLFIRGEEDYDDMESELKTGVTGLNDREAHDNQDIE